MALVANYELFLNKFGGPCAGIRPACPLFLAAPSRDFDLIAYVGFSDCYRPYKGLNKPVIGAYYKLVPNPVVAFFLLFGDYMCFSYTK